MMITLMINDYLLFNEKIKKIAKVKKFLLSENKVKIEIDEKYIDFFKLFLDNIKRGNNTEIYDYSKLFNLIKNNNFLHSFHEYLSVQDSLKYFMYLDQPILPTKEFISFIKNLPLKTIEINSGIGLIGKYTNISSYDSKIYQPSKILFFELLKKFKAYISTQKDKKNREYIEYIGVFDDYKKLPENTFLINNEKYIGKEDTVVALYYLDIPINIFNLQLLIFLEEKSFIKKTDIGYTIFENDITHLFKNKNLFNIKEISFGNKPLNKISHLLNEKSIKFAFNDMYDESRKTMLVFALNFFNLTEMMEMLSSYKLKDFSKLEDDNIIKLTSYNNFIPKNFDNYNELIIEFGENYYIINLDELRKDKNYKKIVLNFKDNKTTVSQKYLWDLFNNNIYLKDLISDYETFEEFKESDEFEWYKIQYLNVTKLLIMFIQKILKKQQKTVLKINIKDSKLNKKDETLLYNYYFGNINYTIYPERVQKLDFLKAVEKEFPNNQHSILLTYNPDTNFSPKKIFEKNKNVFIFAFTRKEFLLKISFYKHHKYMIVQKDKFIMSPFTNSIKDNNDILIVIFNRKNKYPIQNIFNDFNIIKKNF